MNVSTNVKTIKMFTLFDTVIPNLRRYIKNIMRVICKDLHIKTFCLTEGSLEDNPMSENSSASDLLRKCSPKKPVKKWIHRTRKRK